MTAVTFHYSPRCSDKVDDQSKPDIPGQRPRFISPDLVARTIYFPPNVLSRIETRPGALVELLTVLLSDHLQKGATNG